jgi:dihydroxyacid dehydratase/phosphogluconate dehydratase
MKARWPCCGNLAPDGCVIKPTPRRSIFSTPARLVFDRCALDEAASTTKPRRDDRPHRFCATPDRRAPACRMGHAADPISWSTGVRFALRISDARMSGLNTASITSRQPTSAALALVKTGDLITVDVPARIPPGSQRRRTGPTPRHLDAAARRFSAATAG